LEFSELPIQINYRETKLNSKESCVLDNEISKLLVKGVIERASHCDEEYISTIFLVLKKNGKYRMILNLSQLNESIEYVHFKMERLLSALRVMTPNCFMGSVDLTDVYYGVSICEDDRKYLRFIWRGTLYQYTCLPNGLSIAPRLLTKLLKPVYSYLRSQGYISVAYIILFNWSGGVDL